MEIKDGEIREFKIGDKVVCRYAFKTINKKTYLFLKHYNEFFENNEDYEDVIVNIISKVENQKVELLSYLNI